MYTLNEFGVFEENIKSELNEQLPLLSTTKILMECVSAGLGREASVHRRGTPPNVVEMSGDTLIKLVENSTCWDKFCYESLISASGTNAKLEDQFTQVSKLDRSSIRGCDGQ
jgi:hypothetical protein